MQSGFLNVPGIQQCCYVPWVKASSPRTYYRTWQLSSLSVLEKVLHWNTLCTLFQGATGGWAPSKIFSLTVKETEALVALMTICCLSTPADSRKEVRWGSTHNWLSNRAACKAQPGSTGDLLQQERWEVCSRQECLCFARHPEQGQQRVPGPENAGRCWVARVRSSPGVTLCWAAPVGQRYYLILNWLTWT